MTEIKEQHLTPVVAIDESSSMRQLVWQLGEIDTARRQGAVVVVHRADGSLESFRYLEFMELVAEDESVLGLELSDLLPLVGAVASSSVQRVGIGIGDARDRQYGSPGQRLVVLEGSDPVGILIDHAMGGPSVDIASLEHRLFSQRPAMSNGHDQPTSPGDGAEATPGDGAEATPGDGAEATPGEDAPQEPRWLSTRVHADDEQRRQSFKAGATNRVTVLIAPADTDSIQSDEPFPLDPPPGVIYRLDVVVRAPALLEAALRQHIDLPEAGSSTAAEFDLPVPADATEVSVDVDVLFQGRFVQGGRLVGPAVDGADQPGPDGAALRLERTAQSGVDPAVAQPVGATLIVTDETITVNVGATSVSIHVDGIRQFADLIASQLYKAALKEAREAAGLSSGEATRALLELLAYQGGEVHDVLIREVPALADARTIEVTMREAGAFVPIEFVYERGSPAPGAKICELWADHFRDGKTECDGCLAVGIDAPWICPLGFWGLSRHIARRIDPVVSDAESRAARPSNPSPATGRLPRLSRVLVGASYRVDAEVPNQIAETLTVARSLLDDDSVSQVQDWSAWPQAVQAQSPALLLIMSHTELDEAVQAPALEIGAKEQPSRLRSRSVQAAHVGQPAGGGGPIVLLFGCSTAKEEIGYLGFVPAFLRVHAGVVIGTVAKILGRQSAPLAQEFLKAAIRAQDGDVRLGEVMRRVRGEALLSGNPAGLTLAAYGNSDWLLGG